MTQTTDAEWGELIERVNDRRANCTIVEQSPLHIVLEYHCTSPVRRPDGSIEMQDEHLVRLMRSPSVHGILATYEPRSGELPWHPNVRAGPPYIICDNLEGQLDRGRTVPLWSVVDMVFEMLAGHWSRGGGVYNAEATRWYAEAQARGEIPFDERRFI